MKEPKFCTFRSSGKPLWSVRNVNICALPKKPFQKNLALALDKAFLYIVLPKGKVIAINELSSAEIFVTYCPSIYLDELEKTMKSLG